MNKYIHHRLLEEFPGESFFESYDEDKANFMPRQESDTNCLYLIFNPITQLTKIGITSDIFRRYRELQSQSGTRLWVLFYIELEPECDADAKFLERYIHAHFKEHRNRGEWFKLNARQLCSIRAMLWHVHGEHIEDNFEDLKTVLRKPVLAVTV